VRRVTTQMWASKPFFSKSANGKTQTRKFLQNTAQLRLKRLFETFFLCCTCLNFSIICNICKEKKVCICELFFCEKFKSAKKRLGQQISNPQSTNLHENRQFAKYHICWRSANLISNFKVLFTHNRGGGGVQEGYQSIGLAFIHNRRCFLDTLTKGLILCFKFEKQLQHQGLQMVEYFFM
jgi:hypothetical protein